jgi:signal transduction histidine kinase
LLSSRWFDWQTKPFISIGFLYLFPILLVAGFLPRWQMILVALACAVLQELPLVFADRYGLAQVFLNLALSSFRAMSTTETKRLTISSFVDAETVLIRFEDTGAGIPSPEGLFKPFQQGADATGLGLYVSRAILRSCGGDLTLETRGEGCCFAVSLSRVVKKLEASHA